MSTVLPTQKYVLIQMVPKPGLTMVMPDGHRPPGGDIVVIAVGPDVPKEPKMEAGTKVVLRGDANHAIYGMDEKERTGLILSDMIIGVIVESEEKLPTDAEIDAIAGKA